MIRSGERERLGVMEEARQRRLDFARYLAKPIVYVPSKPKPVPDVAVKKKRASPKLRPAPTYPSIVPTLDAVSRATGFSHAQLMGHRKGRKVARARQMTVGLVARQYPGLRTKALGSMFERDRTTIWNSLRQFERYHQVEPMRTWLEHAAIRSLK